MYLGFSFVVVITLVSQGIVSTYRVLLSANINQRFGVQRNPERIGTIQPYLDFWGDLY